MNTHCTRCDRPSPKLGAPRTDPAYCQCTTRLAPEPYPFPTEAKRKIKELESAIADWKLTENGWKDDGMRLLARIDALEEKLRISDEDATLYEEQLTVCEKANSELYPLAEIGRAAVAMRLNLHLISIIVDGGDDALSPLLRLIDALEAPDAD